MTQPKTFIKTQQLKLLRHRFIYGNRIEGTVSMQIYRDFYNWINDPNIKVGEGVSIDNFAIIQSVYKKGRAEGTDLFVSSADQEQICKNVDANNKYYVSFEGIKHFTRLRRRGIADKGNVKEVIYRFLEDKFVNPSLQQSYDIISNATTCE